MIGLVKVKSFLNKKFHKIKLFFLTNFMNEKKSKFVAILLFLILALASLLVVFFLFSKQIFKFSIPNNADSNNIEEHFCTADAKQCPDGSYVSRQQDNNCQFALCSGEENVVINDLLDTSSTLDNLDWQEFISHNGVHFFAPKEISSFSFVRLNEWPPEIDYGISETSASCDTNPDGLPKGTVVKNIGNKVYCVNTSSEGASGSIYYTYVYSTITSEQRYASVSFVAQFPQCLNYDSPEKEDCLTEEQNFNLDKVVDDIIESMAEPAL